MSNSNINNVINQPTPYICDTVRNIGLIVDQLDIDISYKKAIEELLGRNVKLATRMEEALAEKIAILIEDGYAKCSSCNTWHKSTYNQNHDCSAYIY